MADQPETPNPCDWWACPVVTNARKPPRQGTPCKNYNWAAGTECDRRLVEQYLGAFLLLSLKAGPNSAVADNARRAAEAMVVEVRERCAKIADRHAANAKEDRTVWAAESIAAQIRRENERA